MKLSFEDCTYNDFLTLLYIYSASMDLDLAEEEKEIIIDKVGRESFEKTLKCFQNMKDVEVTDLLYKLGHKFCSSEEQRQMAIDDINEIIHVDGRKSRIEEDMLLFINKLI